MAISLYRVTVQLDAWNGANINVFHLDGSTVLPADIGALAYGLFNTFYTGIESYYPTGTSAHLAQIINLGTVSPTYAPFASTPFTWSPSGARSDARQAATITWKSAIATRRGRGRTFLGPLNLNPEDSSTGLWTDTFRTDVQSSADALLAAAAVATAGLQVYSRRAGLSHPVVNANVPRTPHTLRSRTLR